MQCCYWCVRQRHPRRGRTTPVPPGPTELQRKQQQMNIVIDTPTKKDLDKVVQLVGLAQHRPISQVNRGIYEQLCAGGGAIETPVPGIPTVNTGRVARGDDGKVLGFIYAAFPMNHLVPMLSGASEADVIGMMQSITEFNVLAVEPLKHRRGIGTALVDDAVERARAAGVKAAVVTAPDAASTQFWARYGFTIGRCALRFEGVGKIPMDSSWEAQGVLPISDDCSVEQQGGVIACRWGHGA